ncbi:MAG: hypothetical protein LBI28_11770 [Treponema sp.]|jgi:hypothetical protein|nr:hypothetical protein [Treponema sp.]
MQNKTIYTKYPSLLTVFSLLLIALCSLLITNCQTLPSGAQAFLMESGFAPLDSGASAYIFGNVREVRPIIELLPIEELNDRQIRQMLDKTDYVAAAFFPAQSGRRFQLVTWGNYPSNANMGFTLHSGWEKRRGQLSGSFWYSSAGRISVALNTRQAFVAASLVNESRDPVTPPPGMEIPEGFNEFRAGAPLSCWLENPAPAIYRILNEMGIPIRFPVQKLFFNIAPTGEKFESVIRLQFENATQARGVAAILNLAGGFASSDDFIASALFLANPPVQNGQNIDIKTAPLSAREISLLLQMFSLY